MFPQLEASARGPLQHRQEPAQRQPAFLFAGLRPPARGAALFDAPTDGDRAQYRGWRSRNQTETPSVTLWQTYFPYVEVIGVDLTDFSALNNKRFKSFICDQSKLDDLRSVAEKLEPGSLDVIIDDGSHALCSTSN